MNNVTQQELATIIAALRFYQHGGQTDPLKRSDDIHDLATDGDRVASLDDDGIDALCERLCLDDDDSVHVVEAGAVVIDASNLPEYKS